MVRNIWTAVASLRSHHFGYPKRNDGKRWQRKDATAVQIRLRSAGGVPAEALSRKRMHGPVESRLRLDRAACCLLAYLWRILKVLISVRMVVPSGESFRIWDSEYAMRFPLPRFQLSITITPNTPWI